MWRPRTEPPRHVGAVDKHDGIGKRSMGSLTNFPFQPRAINDWKIVGRVDGTDIPERCQTPNMATNFGVVRLVPGPPTPGNVPL